MAVIRFAEFELDTASCELRKRGVLANLQRQPANVLALLASHPGQMLTREEIRKAIWGEDTFVDFDQGLNYCIRQIRTVLRDDSERPRFVETLAAICLAPCGSTLMRVEPGPGVRRSHRNSALAFVLSSS